MANPFWTSIPDAVLDQEKQQKKADDWAQAQHAVVAQQWNDAHTADMQALLAQHGITSDGQGGYAYQTTSPSGMSEPVPSPAPTVMPPAPVLGPDGKLTVPDADTATGAMTRTDQPDAGISDVALARSTTGEAPAQDQGSQDGQPIAPPFGGMPSLVRSPLGPMASMPPPIQQPNNPNQDDQARDRVSRGLAPIEGAKDIVGGGAAKIADYASGAEPLPFGIDTSSPQAALASGARSLQSAGKVAGAALDTGKAGAFISGQGSTAPGAMFAPPEYEALHGDALDILRQAAGRNPSLLDKVKTFLGYGNKLPEDARGVQNLIDFLQGSDEAAGVAGSSARAAGKTGGAGDVLTSAVKAPTPPHVQEVIDTYNDLSAKRAPVIRERATAQMSSALGRPELQPLAEATYDAIKGQLADTKTVFTAVGPAQLRDIVDNGQMRSKFGALPDVDAAAKATMGTVAPGRPGFTPTHAKKFNELEALADQLTLGSSEYRHAEQNAVPRVYARVTEGEMLPDETRGLVYIKWAEDTPRVTTLHHHFGFVAPNYDAHSNMASAFKQELWHADPSKRTTLPSGRTIIDTPWLVGPAAENDMRAATLMMTMPTAVREKVLSGEIRDPEALAAVLLRGGLSKNQPLKAEAVKAGVARTTRQLEDAGLPEDYKYHVASGVNKNRTESLILDPKLDHVEAVYVVGPPKSLAAKATKATPNSYQAAEQLAAAIKRYTGRDVPVVTTPLVPGMTKQIDPRLSPGRGRIVDAYKKAGFPDVGGFTPAGALAGAGTDENGDPTFDPARAALGVAGGTLASSKRVQGAAKRFFHGTGSAFEKPDPATFKEHGTFGPGYYLTDSPVVAETFANARSETRDAAEASLTNLRRQAAETTDPAVRASVERDIARISGDAAVKPGGPNIRAVDVPQDLHLFDAGNDVSEADAVRVSEEMARRLGLDPWEDRAQLSRLGVSRVGGQPGARLWRSVRDALGGDAEQTNDVFAKAGFDGISFDGGRYGLDAPDGSPVTNAATVVFPVSMEKLTNAISGTAGGQAQVGAAVHLAGAVGGGAASVARAEPQQPGESDTDYRLRLAGRAAIGVGTGAVLGAAATSPKLRQAVREVGGARRELGIGPASAPEPDRRDFAAWMQAKKDQAQGGDHYKPPESQIQQKTSMRDMEAFYEQKDAERAAAAQAAVERERLHGPPATKLGDPHDDTDVPPNAGPSMRVEYDENGVPSIAGYDPAYGLVATVAGGVGTPNGRRTAAQLLEVGAYYTKSLSAQEREGLATFKTEVGGVQPWIDKAQTLRYADMLANVVGRAADIGVGIAHTVELPVLDALAGLHGDPALLVSAKARVGGIVGAIPAGFHAAVDAITTGESAFTTSRLEQGAKSARAFGNGPVGRAISLIPDVMTASDDFFKTINGAGAAYAEAAKIARRTGQDVVDVLEHLSDATLTKIERDANYVTYQEDPGAIPKWLAEGARLPQPAGFMVSLAIPFMRVGANIARRGAGNAVRPVIGPFEAAYKAFKGDGEAARMALAKTELAAGLGLLWWSQWAAGNITTNGPDDPQENAAWRAAGNKPNSIKVAGQAVPLTLLGAFGAQAIILTNGFEAAAKHQPVKAQRAAIASGKPQESATGVLAPETERFLMQWIAGTASGLKDISYLKQVGDFLKNPTDPGLLARTASSFVGGDISSRVAQATDPMQREIASGGVDKGLDTLKSRVPGLREQLPVKQDPLGKDVPNPGYGRLMPGDETGTNPSKTLDTMLESGVMPAPAPKSVTVGKNTSVPITRAEQRAYQKYAGVFIDRELMKQQAMPRWEGFDAKKRAEVIKNIKNAAATNAEGRVLKDIGNDELKRRVKGVSAIEPVPIR